MTAMLLNYSKDVKRTTAMSLNYAYDPTDDHNVVKLAVTRRYMVDHDVNKLCISITLPLLRHDR